MIFNLCVILTGKVYHRLLQRNTPTAIWLTCCKILLRHWAFRKLWSTKLPSLPPPPPPPTISGLWPKYKVLIMYQHFCKTNKTKVDTTLMYFSMSAPYGCLELLDQNLLQNRISICRTEGLLCGPAHFVKTEILLH